jgi:hypothetical protein
MTILYIDQAVSNVTTFYTEVVVMLNKAVLRCDGLAIVERCRAPVTLGCNTPYRMDGTWMLVDLVPFIIIRPQRTP